jgi:hypothetical protein
MANQKITDLTVGSALTGSELFESVQNGGSVKLTADALKTFSQKQAVNDSLVLNGTTDSTTAYCSYGFNVVLNSDSSNFCARLPNPPSKGQSVTIINTSNYIARIFPSVTGGTINGVVDGHYDIPANSLPYTFICFENPNPGYWAIQNRPLSNTLVYPEISIAHTQGTAQNYAGVNTMTSSAIGSGIDGSNNLTLTPDSSYWASENMVARATTCRVYTNVVPTDMNSHFMTVGIYGAYKTGTGSSTSGQRGTALISDSCTFNPATGDYCQSVVGGVLSSPPNVGDVGTYYFEFSTINADLGLGGTFNIYSRFYYIFAVLIDAQCISKTYKFRFELDYI